MEDIMVKSSHHIYQLKISLLEISPSIWRRIQVPDTFAISNLHEAVQKAMGWHNCHLYQFFPNLNTREEIPEKELLKNFFGANESSSHGSKKIYYEYDFGDSWMHEILLEKMLPAKPNIKYPVCLTGKRACPPEDCGGVPGYYNLVGIMENSKHPEYRSMKQWLGRKFCPEEFNHERVCFAADK